MKRRTLACLFLLVSLLMAGCQAAPALQATAVPAPTEQPAALQRFTRRGISVFDTEVSLSGFAKSQEDFDRIADGVVDQLREYNQIFDGYNAYGDLHNLYYVNLHAAEEAVQVPDVFFDLLLWCRDMWARGYRETNIAMGSVLKIWHDYRTAGIADPEHAVLPPMEQLQAASAHTGFEKLVLDEENRTVYFADPEMRIDLGAVAKGYAADLVLPWLMREMPSFLLSLGGNVYAGNAPLDGRDHWNVGVQNPHVDAAQLALGATEIMDVLEVKDVTVVTSGDYWRFYQVEGKKYHHIIDPETLMPSEKMVSVTVVCKSSLLADYLSTTLFILSYEDGLKLVQELGDIEVMWVEADGTQHFTPGMAQLARSLKTAQ